MQRLFYISVVLLGGMFSLSAENDTNIWEHWRNYFQTRSEIEESRSLIYGYTYDPEETDFVLVNFARVYPYGDVWKHKAPNNLFFKTELNFGYQMQKPTGVIASANIFAQLEHDWFGGGVIPYSEAGIGIVYTDFQFKHQGLRVNFNPQLGFGLKISKRLFFAIRLYHVSNGNLHEENRGINSVMLQIGL